MTRAGWAARVASSLVVALVTVWLARRAAGLGGGVALAAASTALDLGVVVGVVAAICAPRLITDTRERRRRSAAFEQDLRTTADIHRFSVDLHEALELTESETDVLEVTTLALGLLHHLPAEVLLADAGRMQLGRAGTAGPEPSPGCGVETPGGCPAIRRGQILQYDHSVELATCPHLRRRGGDVSAMCVPVTILGSTMGVIHVTGPAGGPPGGWRRQRLESVAQQAGARLGMLRAMATSEMAGATDPLTGLLNRRSLEAELQALEQHGRPFAVAFADLDHFKALNDGFGHAAGDRALRHFAQVAASVLREEDLACRFGGEEFVFVMEGCDATEAAQAMQRLRAALEASVGTAGVPRYTVSVGLADSTFARSTQDVIAAADFALLEAKRSGRDRLVVATGSQARAVVDALAGDLGPSPTQ